MVRVISFKIKQLILIIHMFFNKKFKKHALACFLLPQKVPEKRASLNELRFDQVKRLDLGDLIFKCASNNTGGLSYVRFTVRALYQKYYSNTYA
jgi:hypothetical protein